MEKPNSIWFPWRIWEWIQSLRTSSREELENEVIRLRRQRYLLIDLLEPFANDWYKLKDQYQKTEVIQLGTPPRHRSGPVRHYYHAAVAVGLAPPDPAQDGWLMPVVPQHMRVLPSKEGGSDTEEESNNKG